MNDLQPAPVPELSEYWINAHRSVLIDALTEPRTKPVRWIALSGATATATASTLFLTLFLGGGSAPYAFAGWSPAPTAATSAQLSTAETACQSALGQQLPFATNKSTDPASLTPEVSDVRGPYTVTLLGNSTSQSEVICVSEGDNSSIHWIDQSDTPASPGSIAVDQVSFASRDGQAYTLVAGRTGDGVTGVSLMLSDGESVTTTVGNGFFVAWWPGSENITSASVATATGTTSQPLNLQGPGNPPATKSAPPGTSSGSSNANTVCSLNQRCAGVSKG